jgi:phosphosulfolactate synthase
MSMTTTSHDRDAAGFSIDASLDALHTTKSQLSIDAGRVGKPRSSGITMVLVFDVANYGPSFVAPYSQLVDKVKILDTMWHDDLRVFADAVEAYRALDISVACGGTQFELALAQGSMTKYVEMLKGLGINEVEVEHHADAPGLDEMRREVLFFKEHGLSVIGEVGKKWWWKDQTRLTRDAVSVNRTVESINTFAEAGADWIYWEGAVVCGLIGRQLENEAGQQQLLDVMRQVDQSKIVFEVYDRRGQPIYPILAWLVRHFGPNVNLANIEPWLVKRVEWIRHGITFEMDHPYMRWKADPSISSNWWGIPEVPDYSIDVQRPYRFDADLSTGADR